MALESPAASRASAAVCDGSHAPAAAVASFSDVYLILYLPALSFACDSASLMPFTSGSVCAVEEPDSGRLEHQSTVPAEATVAVFADELTAVPTEAATAIATTTAILTAAGFLMRRIAPL